MDKGGDEPLLDQPAAYPKVVGPPDGENGYPSYYRPPVSHSQHTQVPMYAQDYPRDFPQYNHSINSTNRWPAQHQWIADDDQLLDVVIDNETPPNHCLALSIFVTVCCCLPLGIAAIIFSSRAMKAIGANDLPLARQKARTARSLGISGLVIGMFSLGFTIYRIVLFYHAWKRN